MDLGMNPICSKLYIKIKIWVRRADCRNTSLLGLCPMGSKRKRKKSYRDEGLHQAPRGFQKESGHKLWVQVAWGGRTTYQWPQPPPKAIWNASHIYLRLLPLSGAPWGQVLEWGPEGGQLFFVDAIRELDLSATRTKDWHPGEFTIFWKPRGRSINEPLDNELVLVLKQNEPILFALDS